LPEGIGTIGYVFFVDEEQIVPVEVVEPFVPRDVPKPLHAREIEADSSATIVDSNGGGAGRSGFARGGLCLAPLGPAADDVMVLGPDGARPACLPMRARSLRELFVLWG
jgi:hypothetical protein